MFTGLMSVVLQVAINYTEHVRQKQSHNKSITYNVCKFIKQVAESSKTTNLKLQNM